MSAILILDDLFSQLRNQVNRIVIYLDAATALRLDQNSDPDEITDAESKVVESMDVYRTIINRYQPGNRSMNQFVDLISNAHNFVLQLVSYRNKLSSLGLNQTPAQQDLINNLSILIDFYANDFDSRQNDHVIRFTRDRYQFTRQQQRQPRQIRQVRQARRELLPGFLVLVTEYSDGSNESELIPNEYDEETQTGYFTNDGLIHNVQPPPQLQPQSDDEKKEFYKLTLSRQYQILWQHPVINALRVLNQTPIEDLEDTQDFDSCLLDMCTSKLNIMDMEDLDQVKNTVFLFKDDGTVTCMSFIHFYKSLRDPNNYVAQWKKRPDTRQMDESGFGGYADLSHIILKIRPMETIQIEVYNPPTNVNGIQHLNAMQMMSIRALELTKISNNLIQTGSLRNIPGTLHNDIVYKAQVMPRDKFISKINDKQCRENIQDELGISLVARRIQTYESKAQK